MGLPILTTADDVRGIVGYLRNKATGADISEARAALGGPAVDPRKLSAYQFWQLVVKDGNRLKLSPRGWELARKTKPEATVFREVLDSTPAYRSALEWAFHQKMDTVTNVDVASQWHEHHSDAAGTDNANTIKDQAVCFFRICEAAGLGEMVIGRRGQATRFNLAREALGKYIEAGPSEPPWVEPPAPAEEEEAPSQQTRPIPAASPPSSVTEKKPSSDDLRVFISHGKNTELVEQVETMLGLADIASEVAVKEETAAIPVPDKVFNAMKRCSAAIIVVSVDENQKDAKGNFTINENVLIEIGAAFVLYDKKVVLLWDRRITVPSNLQGLYRCEYEGNDLNWGAGIKLMKAIKGFRSAT
jgi:Predicted nucleotide-binding protein containing TIR-like domain